MIYSDEADIRRDIIEAGRRLYMKNLICAGDGNLSARVSEREIIATPSGVCKGFMTVDMLVTLDIDGKQLSGNLEPSSEIKMHLAVYRESPDILAVCHAHPPVASAFAASGAALDQPFLQEAVMLLGVIPVARYAAPGSEELAQGAAAYAADYHGALLEHHGAVTWGSSVMQALFRMESIEHMATVAMHSKMMGFTRTLNKAQVDELIAMRANWGITAALGEFREDSNDDYES
ncbi:MAG: class II aldolase/adducin family protein [Oscillospiraceae bacterium]|nr:class II aldolase/adducin family protein [Oscillospiraceae bacterium]